jgi:hypothetical protein
MQQLDVGTSFIGGGDQSYIACPQVRVKNPAGISSAVVSSQNGGPLHFGRLFPVWDLLPALAAFTSLPVA